MALSLRLRSRTSTEASSVTRAARDLAAATVGPGRERHEQTLPIPGLAREPGRALRSVPRGDRARGRRRHRTRHRLSRARRVRLPHDPHQGRLRPRAFLRPPNERERGKAARDLLDGLLPVGTKCRLTTECDITTFGRYVARKFLLKQRNREEIRTRNAALRLLNLGRSWFKSAGFCV